jgi:hypothetical protein
MKYDLGRSLYIGQESSNRWRFAVQIFREGFGNFVFQILHLHNLFQLSGLLFSLANEKTTSA